MGRYMLLWLLGVPIPILVLVWFSVDFTKDAGASPASMTERHELAQKSAVAAQLPDAGRPS